jgi:sterol desaturase/sphingolipid hydroxylase (fatty acid hydroxylase superfamily)
MDALGELFTTVQAWLFEAAIQPVMFAIGLGQLLAEGYDATGWLLVGLLQLLVLACVIGPLQSWRPVEPVADRATVRTDMLYTLLHRLGLFRLAMFFLLEPALNGLFSWMRVAGLPTLHLDAFWPGVSDLPWVSFLLYLVVLDAFNYAVHRAQHGVGWWWQLHALHHAQRQMTMWSDNRNHLLDDMLRDLIVIVIAQLIGIAPGQYVAIVALTQLSESFQHANLRLWFGPLGERLWVSPRFHRMHHAIGRGERQNCNFGVLLPCWDMLFGTADFSLRYEPTGVLDQTTQGRDYGRGLLAQQWQGLKRLVGRA